MKKFLGFAIAALSAIALVSGAQAQVIYSVQFGSTVAFDSGNAGPDPVAASSFNSDTAGAKTYFATETSGINDLFDQNGIPSGIDETKTDYGGYHAGGAVSGFSTTGDNDLFNGANVYADNSGDTPFILNLSGLSATSVYDLYIIVHDPNGATGTVINGFSGSQSFYLSTIGNSSIGSYVQGIGLTSATANAGDYFEFTGLTGSTTATATLTSGGEEVAGFQLVQLVPEPSTVCLTGLGLVGLVCFVRRKAMA